MESGMRIVRKFNGAQAPGAAPEPGRAKETRGHGTGGPGPHPEAPGGRSVALQARPLAELLNCPPDAGILLTDAAQSVEVQGGEVVFRQSEICRGLYVVIAGQFVRRTERHETRLNLGSARPGDLVELAAALGDGRHTYTLTALVAGAVLMLPLDALRRAFEAHPPLRMQLLEELAREVSRSYDASIQSRLTITRRRPKGAGPA
jgi:CRP-like cAMP-binding protein